MTQDGDEAKEGIIFRLQTRHATIAESDVVVPECDIRSKAAVIPRNVRINLESDVIDTHIFTYIKIIKYVSNARI